MNKAVRITVTGVSDSGNPEEMPEFTQTVAEGHYGVINEKGVVSYEETDEDTGALTKTLVRFDEGSLEVTRKGNIESKLVFTSGERYETAYATPYGSFTMATVTEEFRREESEEKIELHVTYDMELNNEFVSKNSIVIEILFI